MEDKIDIKDPVMDVYKSLEENKEVITTTPIVGPKAIAVNKFINLIYNFDS